VVAEVELTAQPLPSQSSKPPLMKKWLNNAIDLFPVWGISVAVVYFYNTSAYLAPINPDLNRTLLEVILYFLFHVAIVSIPIFSLLRYKKKKKFKFKPTILKGFLCFLVLTFVITSVRVLWEDLGYYDADPLITRDGEIILLQDELRETDEIMLERGTILIDANKTDPIFKMYDDQYNLVRRVPFFEGLLHTVVTLSLQLGMAFLLLIAMYAIGAKLFDWFDKKMNAYERFSFSLGLGFIITSLALFLLAHLNQLSFIPVGALLGLFVLIGYKKILSLPSLLTQDLSKGFPLKQKWEWLLLGMVFLVMSWNFIEISSPIPEGFDDFKLYLNLPNELAQKGGYLFGQYPYAFSLIQSMGLILFNKLSVAKLMVFMSSVFSLPLFYTLLKRYVSSSLAWLATATLYSIPLVYIHQYLQVKDEFVLVFIGLLSLLAAHFYLDARVKKQQLKWLFLAGLFAGFSFSIKITGAFWLATLAFMVFTRLFKTYGSLFITGALFFVFSFFHLVFLEIIFDFVQSTAMIWISGGLLVIGAGGILRESFKSFSKFKPKFIQILVLTIGVLIPMLPWVGSNAISNQSLAPMSLIHDAAYETPVIDWDLMEVPKSSNWDLQSSLEDAPQYYPIEHSNQFIALLLLPWDLTQNLSTQNIMVNMGFLFLAFCPVLLFKRPQKKDIKPSKHFDLMMKSASFFWIVWMLIATQLLWHGIMGFFFFLFWFVAAVIVLERHSSFTKWIAYGLIAVWLIAGFYTRSNLFFARTHTLLPVLSGNISEIEYTDLYYNDFLEFADILNSDLDSTIYMTDDGVLYFFIENNSHRVSYGSFLSTFGRLYAEEDEALLLSRLQKTGFDYLVLKKPLEDEVIDDPERSRLEFEILKIANANYPLLRTNDRLYIYALN
jgi:hypothetical protein